MLLKWIGNPDTRLQRIWQKTTCSLWSLWLMLIPGVQISLSIFKSILEPCIVDPQSYSITKFLSDILATFWGNIELLNGNGGVGGHPTVITLSVLQSISLLLLFFFLFF